MTKKEQEQREEIMDIFIRSLTANIEEIDGNRLELLAPC